MPWHLPADLAWFRKNTLGKPVIMGRKTLKVSVARCPNVSISCFTPPLCQGKGVIWKNSLESAVDFLKDHAEIMLIGGGELFKQYLPQTDRLYLTEIQTQQRAIPFSPIDWQDWDIEFEEYRPADCRQSLCLSLFYFSTRNK